MLVAFGGTGFADLGAERAPLLCMGRIACHGPRAGLADLRTIETLPEALRHIGIANAAIHAGFTSRCAVEAGLDAIFQVLVIHKYSPC